MIRTATNTRIFLLFWVACTGAFHQKIGVGVMASSPERLRGEDGTLSLLVAVPLTKNNETVLDPGWFHMASALLAVDHFNERSAAIVPELDEEFMTKCPYTFAPVHAVDTGVNSHQAMEFIVQQLQKDGPVDAIAGPYNEIPALELSVLATGMTAPIVSHRAFDSNLLSPQRHPYFSQVSDDFFSRMQFLSRYLRHIQRDNYIAILYCSTASEIQQADVVTTVLAQDGFDQVQSFSYKPTVASTTGDEGTARDKNEASTRSIRDALEKIKKTGYRTIYVLPSSLDRETPLISTAAAEFGLDEGDHMWVLSGGLAELSSREILEYLSDVGTSASFLRGAAYFYAVDETGAEKFSDLQLIQRNKTFLERVEALNPIADYFGDSLQDIASSANPIQSIVEKFGSFTQGSSYMYDAVMAIGLGACKASFALDQNQNSTAITGKNHLDGIRSVDFHGASGRVAFGGASRTPGSRAADTIPFAIVNLLPEGDTGPLFVYTEIYDPSSRHWIEHAAFVYAGGRNTPPARLRDEPEMNYLSPHIRATGLALMSIALFCVLLSVIWVFVKRNHSVVIAAQPLLLYALCLGSAMVALVILLSSYDESYGWDKKMLSKACVGNIWLDSLGNTIALGALFTKLWRVYRCMLFKTTNTEVWRVIWPGALLLGVMISLLIALTLSGSHYWERKVTDEITGESIGRCTSEDGVVFLFPIYTLHFVPMILAGIMAFKTSGVDDLYSEAKWVLAFILVQGQVLFVGVPVVSLLQDVNSDIKYICYTLLMFTFPMSTMGLIILPKVLIVRRMEKQANAPDATSDPALVSLPVSNPDEPPSANDTPMENTIERELRESPAHHSYRGPRMQVVTFD